MAEVQADLFGRAPGNTEPPPSEPGWGCVLSFAPRLAAAARASGPKELAAAAPADEALLAGEWTGYDPEPGPRAFFARALLQPLAEKSAPQWRPRADAEAPGCPRCGGRPLAGILREDREAEALRRTLLCSFCLSEWDFPRVLCPACREERPEKLPRLEAREIPWIRVEACDACGKYLKAVDLSKEPGAEPVVDELASTPLDLLARERGYEKIAPNLAGL